MSLEDTSAAPQGAVESVSTPDGKIATGPTIKAPAPPAALMPANNKDAELDDNLQAVWDKHHKARGEDGKFAPKDGAKPEGEAAPALEGKSDKPPKTDQPAVERVKGAPAKKDAAEASKAPVAETPDAPAQEAPKPAKPAIEAPNAWSGEMKTKFATLPPEVQTYVSQREGEAHKAITRAGERLKQFEPISQVLQQYDDVFKHHGADHVQGVQFLLRAQKDLDADPVQGLVKIGQSYGIDLKPFFAKQPGQEAPAARGPDPLVQQLTARLNQVEGQLAARQRNETEAQAADVESTLATFAKDHPHFDAVKRVMGALMTSGEADDLEQAYDMAVHATPAIRTRILEDQRSAEEERRTGDAKAKAEAARRASGGNVRSDFAQPSPKSEDEVLRGLAMKHYGRAS